MSKRTGTYEEIPAASIPPRIVFTVPRRNQGQMVEYAYSRGIPAGGAGDMEADEGDPYMRVTDERGTVTYYRRGE